MSSSSSSPGGGGGGGAAGGGATGGTSGSGSGSGSSRGRLFFCHQCNRSIREVKEDFTCARCDSGFIEEFDTNGAGAPGAGATAAGGGGPHQTPFPPLLDALFGGASAAADGHGGSGPNAAQFNIHFGGGGGGPPGAVGGAGAAVAANPIIQEIFNNLLGIQGAQQPQFMMYGNPGDYAWGRGGFDQIVTQLLNQMEGTGPPPLKKDSITKIPQVKITQEHTESSAQCSVCWEDFKLDELVRRLNCDHLYHEPCIVPWLELHATCPICRQSQQPEGEEPETAGSPQPSADGAAAGVASSGPVNASATGTSLGDVVSSVVSQVFGPSFRLTAPSSSSSTTTASQQQPPSSTSSSSLAASQDPSTSSSSSSTEGGARRRDRPGQQQQQQRPPDFEDFDLE